MGRQLRQRTPLLGDVGPGIVAEIDPTAGGQSEQGSSQEHMAKGTANHMSRLRHRRSNVNG
jgi:hypothetical protein